MHFFICTSGHVAHRLLCSSAFQCAHPTNPLPLTCFSTLVFFFSLTIGFPVHWFAAIAQPTQLISLIPQSPPHPNDRHLPSTAIAITPAFAPWWQLSLSLQPIATAFPRSSVAAHLFALSGPIFAFAMTNVGSVLCH